MKIITLDQDKCVGCRLCELACSLINTGGFNPSRARIHVIGFDELFTLPVSCFQCEKPYCLEVCPSNAIVKDQLTGIVTVTRDKCVGCRACMLACPFGNITFSDRDKAAVKCELCDGEPECVLFCPTKALEFAEADVAMIRKKAVFADKLKVLFAEARTPEKLEDMGPDLLKARDNKPPQSTSQEAEDTFSDV